MEYSTDQKRAFDAIEAILADAGVDLGGAEILPEASGKARVLAVLGKAGSGKTLLLANVTLALKEIGVKIVSPDFESRKTRKSRNFAVLAPTNKAASVLRNRGVPATTIHRILYTPIYDADYEKIAEWLMGESPRPETDALAPEALDRAMAFYKEHASVPGALAAAGLRGSDFITGWKRREEPLDIGFVDEASMLDPKQLEDLREIFTTLVLFGDPAQLAPVGNSGDMAFDDLPDKLKIHLSRIHRQAADNPILDLAHMLSDPALDFATFEREIEAAAAKDDRVQIAQRVDAAMMARSPVLVWRNDTRKRLIQAFRTAYQIPIDAMMPGEPLICDGLELPMKHRKRRIDLEARGLIKGAQVVYLGAGNKPGFAKLHVLGAEEPRVNAASIIQIEHPNEEEPFIASAARMGALFLHGAACTIHKAQGSQWPEVQVFAPDLFAAARTGRSEAGLPLWQRLAYVAITRAEERLIWVTRYRLARPEEPLGIEDLPNPQTRLTLEAQTQE
ncbi:ATP-dependent DNA helicase [Paracoccaceae bacterium GXU_MW_L88]